MPRKKINNPATDLGPVFASAPLSVITSVSSTEGSSTEEYSTVVNTELPPPSQETYKLETPATPSKVYGALVSKFTDKSIKSKKTPPVNFFVGCSFPGDEQEYYINADGIALGVPQDVLTQLHDRLSPIFDISQWEYHAAESGLGKESKDYDLVTLKYLLDHVKDIKLAVGFGKAESRIEAQLLLKDAEM